jgi:hypothetical protein
MLIEFCYNSMIKYTFTIDIIVNLKQSRFTPKYQFEKKIYST